MMIVVTMTYSASIIYQVHPCFIYFCNLLKYIFSLCFMYEETEIQKGLVIFPMLYSQYKGLICALNYSMFLAILFFFSCKGYIFEIPGKVTSLRRKIEIKIYTQLALRNNWFYVFQDGWKCILSFYLTDYLKMFLECWKTHLWAKSEPIDL